MTDANPTVDLAHLTADPGRFRQFVKLDLVTAVTGAVVLVSVWILLDAAWLWPLTLAVVIAVVLLASSLRLYRSGHVNTAVLAVCTTFWLMLVITPVVIPSLFPGFALLMVWPVLFALPHVRRATLLGISIVTGVAGMAGLLLATRPNPPEVAQIPTLLLNIVFVLIGLTFVGLSLVTLYGYSGRLGEVVDGLHTANEALLASERSLEAKVAERTAELERANADLLSSREETARARDEAVGLSRELEAVLDNLAEGLLVVDSDGCVVRVNPALTRMLDRPVDDLLGRPVAVVLPAVAGLAAADPTAAVTVDITLAGNRLGKAVASGVTDPDERTLRGTVVLVSDVTAAREVDRMKTDFISTVSHELRTPLTSILGFAKIIAKRLDERILPLVRDPDPRTTRAIEQVRGNLDIIFTEGSRLTALINDVLDIAKMEAGQIEWRDEDVVLETIAGEAAAATAALFDAKGIALHLNLRSAGAVVRGDPHRLEQVVINLLSNACKFTVRGEVRLSTRVRDGEVVLAVRDTGPGVAVEDQPQLFARFKQVGDTLTGKPQGTGLGLPICKEIIEHHRGRIWVESTVGIGSTFSFGLPRHGAVPALPAPSTAVDARVLLRDLHSSLAAPRSEGPPRILVVDDHPPLRQLLREELEGVGYEVFEAADGREALRLAKEVAPDLITLDVLMPELNGFDVAAVLRHDPVTMRIPIMIISVVEQGDRGRQIGVDRYLTKPIESSDLLAQVDALLAQGTTRRRVIVVDSDESMLETLRSTLEQQGWEVSAVPDPGGALAVTRAAVPDVVLANAALSDRFGLVDVMRAERGMERVVFVLFE